jgi:hypothetical protein
VSTVAGSLTLLGDDLFHYVVVPDMHQILIQDPFLSYRDYPVTGFGLVHYFQDVLWLVALSGFGAGMVFIMMFPSMMRRGVAK